MLASYLHGQIQPLENFKRQTVALVIPGSVVFGASTNFFLFFLSFNFRGLDLKPKQNWLIFLHLADLRVYISNQLVLTCLSCPLGFGFDFYSPIFSKEIPTSGTKQDDKEEETKATL